MFFAHVYNDINARLGKQVLTPLEQVRVVSKLVNWPDEWRMPGPDDAGSVVRAPAGSVPWWSLLILGILALAAGTVMGVFVPR